MKSSGQLGVIASLAVLAGLGHWLVDGRPSGDPVSDFETRLESMPLKDGEVRLSEVHGKPGVLWVDARPKEKWQADGLPGSISVTTLSDEDLGTQLVSYENELFGAGVMVIYCDDVNCSLSHDLVKQLKTRYADFLPPEVKVLHGGHVALKAAGLVKSSSPAP